MEGQGGGLSHGGNDADLDPAEVVDAEVAEEAQRRGHIIQVQAAFSGPIPPPEMLAQYNEVLPNGADRIVKMAEDQSAHRRRVESRGQIFGFALALLAIGGGIALIASGHSVAGLVPLVTAIGGLIGVFIYGETRARNARKIKAPDEESRSDTGT